MCSTNQIEIILLQEFMHDFGAESVRHASVVFTPSRDFLKKKKKLYKNSQFNKRTIHEGREFEMSWKKDIS